MSIPTILRGWKPQKVGVDFESRGPEYNPFLVWRSLRPNCAHFWPFWVIFRMFLGHNAELKATTGLFYKMRPRWLRHMPVVILYLAVLNSSEEEMVLGLCTSC